MTKRIQSQRRIMSWRMTVYFFQTMMITLTWSQTHPMETINHDYNMHHPINRTLSSQQQQRRLKKHSSDSYRRKKYNSDDNNDDNDDDDYYQRINKNNNNKKKKNDKPKEQNSNNDNKNNNPNKEKTSSSLSSRRCTSMIADQLRRRVPDIITWTPDRCCSYFGPTAVIVTHALYERGTLESYWEDFYQQLEQFAAKNVCFIMTGIDVDQTTRSITTILVDVNTAAATNAQVPVLFSTDPTDNGDNDLTLVNTMRTIADLRFGPLVAIFNRGYDSVVKEALVSGNEPLPYVGSITDNTYGVIAAETTLQLLNQTRDNNDVAALCLNARTDLPFVGERCRRYYDGFNKPAPIWPPDGLACSTKSSTRRLAELYQVNRITAVYAHGECCAGAVQAATIMTEWDIIVGCMDERIEGSAFLVGASVPLQAYHVMSQINFPIQTIIREDYDLIDPFFPSPKSLVQTDVQATAL